MIPRSNTELRNMLLPLLEDQMTPNSVVVVVAELIAQDARLNEWVSVEGKKSLDSDSLVAALEPLDRLPEQLSRDITRWREDGDHSAFERAITSAVTALSPRHG